MEGLQRWWNRKRIWHYAIEQRRRASQLAVAKISTRSTLRQLHNRGWDGWQRSNNLQNAFHREHLLISLIFLGDLYNNENIKDLGYRIQTQNGLVDLVVADGVSVCKCICLNTAHLLLIGLHIGI